MPVKPPSACSVCLRRNCTKHRKQDTRTRNATQRGYDSDWRKLRDAHLAEYPLCGVCFKQGRVTAASEVHHKVGIRDDPSRRLDRTNLLSLCHPCHMQIEADSRRN